MYSYSPEYYAHFERSSARSAAIMLPLVQSIVRVKSVADFGCGTGEWLAEWVRLGVSDVVGCDSPDVNVSALRFDATRFVPADLASAVDVGRRFDLVQSLEVAEHLASAAAHTFVETLVSHGPVVMFSAASPGQGGEHHVNEQPLEYWRRLFRQHGFLAVDALRPRLVRERQVAPWYRYNVILFVQHARLAELDATLRACRVGDDVTLREYAPPLVRLRQRIMRHLPSPIVTRMAVALRRFSGPR